MICTDLGPYRKAGRPVALLCPRGHQRQPKTKCVECRKLKDKARYQRIREEKKAYAKEWRRKFKERTGIPAGTWYSYKGPKMTTEVLVAAAEGLHVDAMKPSMAYRLGAEAFRLGIKRGHNPFRVDCVYEWTQWRAGWDASFQSTPVMSQSASASPRCISA